MGHTTFANPEIGRKRVASDRNDEGQRTNSASTWIRIRLGTVDSNNPLRENQDIYLGVRTTGIQEYEGLMDDVKIYSVALTRQSTGTGGRGLQ